MRDRRRTPSPRSRVWRPLLVGVTLLATTAASSALDGGHPTPTTVVTVAADALEPEHVAVDLGEVVRWRNDSPFARVVSEDAFALFASDIVNPVVGTFEYATQVAGTYTYRAAIPGVPVDSEPVELHGTLGVAPYVDGVEDDEAQLQLRFRWATRFVPDAWAFDLEYAKLTPEQFNALPDGAESVSWQTLDTGVHAHSGLVPAACDGLFHVLRVRLRDGQSGLVSDWSPPGGSSCVQD